MNISLNFSPLSQYKVSVNYNLGMFYVAHLLQAQLIFSHSDLRNLSTSPFILSKLKQNFEGRCLEEYGYLVQVLPMKGYDSKEGLKVGQIKVTSKGCEALIQFDCLCFKPKKRDIIDIFITEINGEFVRGKIGAAEVMITRHWMGGCEFDQKSNTYSTFICDGTRLLIGLGESLRCRVVNWSVQGDSVMKILGEVDSSLLDSKVIGRF